MTEGLTPERRRKLTELSKRLGVSFKNIAWLDQALTHSSYANESRNKSVIHNERLEFLGDAVLELAISTYLFDKYPGLPEGELTKARAAVVCEASLSQLAADFNFGDYMRFGNGEMVSGGATRPSILEDAFESVIGAVYMDQGWDAARDYVMHRLSGHISEYAAGVSNVKDYKTILQEYVQKRFETKVHYDMLSSEGPDHAKVFEFAVLMDDKVLGVGKGHSKKSAEQQAAQQALAGFKYKQKRKL